MKLLCGLTLAGTVAAVGIVGLAGTVTVLKDEGFSLVGFPSDGSANGSAEYHGCTLVMPQPDYPQLQPTAEWAFKDAETTLDFALSQPQDRYTVRATSAVSTDAGRTVHVSLGEREVYSFAGHHQTVFAIVGHRLYVAEAESQLVAVDLTTGTELWRTTLAAAGGDGGLSLNLSADGDAVTLLGVDNGKRFVEILDPATGDTAAHKVLD